MYKFICMLKPLWGESSFALPVNVTDTLLSAHAKTAQSLVFSLFVSGSFFFSVKAGFSPYFHPKSTLLSSLPLPFSLTVSISLPVCSSHTWSYYRIINRSQCDGTKWSRKGMQIVADIYESLLFVERNDKTVLKKVEWKRNCDMNKNKFSCCYYP